jgi:hypothetical protein
MPSRFPCHAERRVGVRARTMTRPRSVAADGPVLAGSWFSWGSRQTPLSVYHRPLAPARGMTPLRLNGYVMR